MRVGITLIFLGSLFCVSIVSQTKSSIVGVWRITEVTTAGPNGSINESPQPGLLIFMRKHYSQTIVTSKEPRTRIEDASKSTVAEMTAVYVDGFVGNAGTYELKGDKITIRPIVAKSPTFMDGTGYITYRVTVTGKSLTLTEESASFGPLTNPQTTKLIKIE